MAPFSHTSLFVTQGWPRLVAFLLIYGNIGLSLVSNRPVNRPRASQSGCLTYPTSTIPLIEAFMYYPRVRRMITYANTLTAAYLIKTVCPIRPRTYGMCLALQSKVHWHQGDQRVTVFRVQMFGLPNLWTWTLICCQLCDTVIAKIYRSVSRNSYHSVDSFTFGIVLFTTGDQDVVHSWNLWRNENWITQTIHLAPPTFR